MHSFRLGGVPLVAGKSRVQLLYRLFEAVTVGRSIVLDPVPGTANWCSVGYRTTPCAFFELLFWEV